ncbi:MAG: response regulator receiver [Gemmatimonadetes bacterium]|nr:response regulator receiver [Gemmatimonadota bacterium]
MTSSQIANTYRVVVVDDEPLARDGLRDAVERAAVPGVSVVALCENGVVALDRIRELQPEILLLDVAMPVLDGFAMLEQLEPEATPPAVIFVTAYDEHAVRAFDAEALDFLVKPVADARLRAALERAVRRIAEARALRAGLDAEPPPVAAGRYVQQLVIPDRGRRLVVPVDEVEWIEGDTYYVRVHAQGRVRLLRERLSRLEASLDPARFHRTHRSALVRLDLIRELRADSPYAYSALLSTGARVPVSRERVKQLEARLKV